jgi:proline racemase
VKRSPAVSSTAALIAVLDAMGLVDENEFVHEGIAGASIRGHVARRTLKDEVPLVIPEIIGSATVTGYHEFVF